MDSEVIKRAVRDDRLSRRTVQTLDVIARAAAGGNAARLPISEIARRIVATERTVELALKTLEANGYIKRERLGTGPRAGTSIALLKAA